MYYLLTVVTFLLIEHYFLRVLSIENIYLLAIVLLCFVMLGGVLISKLAIDPLAEYVRNLQALSKETLHELNLPISTIVTNSQMLKKSLDDEKSHKRVERIEGACDMLKERYNELEYMIKMQSRQNIKENFRVDALVEDRLMFLKRVYAHMDFSTNLSPLEIYGDRAGLAKVIDNIIDNGVKYSQNSHNIVITMEGRNLCIEDYGIGMNEVEIIKIFDQFYQANATMEGFGIGLSMVKRYCDTNDIGLTIESKPNIGTKVKLQFKTGR